MRIYGRPACIVSDNRCPQVIYKANLPRGGAEVTSRSILPWADHIAFIEAFNGSLCDELPNNEFFDNLNDARRKLALWCYAYDTVRPRSSLGNQRPQQAQQALEQFEGPAPNVLAHPEPPNYQKAANSRYERGTRGVQISIKTTV